jgi:hypothetical protein
VAAAYMACDVLRRAVETVLMSWVSKAVRANPLVVVARIPSYRSLPACCAFTFLLRFVPLYLYVRL